MLIAREKKKENIIEYILYMWQVEDLIRAYKFDISSIEEGLILQFNQPAYIKEEIKQWYIELIKLMKKQGVENKGHLEFLNNTVKDLYRLHLQILKSQDESQYFDIYCQALPNIKDLDARSKNNSLNEIETCLNGLYGLLMLRLQKKDISSETTIAMTTFSKLLAYLAAKYKEGI